MAWNILETTAGVEEIRKASHARPQLIFKHSTRCGISAGAKRRMEGGLGDLAERFELHFLDLINHRDVSNEVAQLLGVHHESPQVIVVEKGEATFHTSHGIISPSFILEQTQA